MKELYTFPVERTIEKTVPHVRKVKGELVETTKKVKEKKKYRVVVAKPTMSDIEDAEFFYGQKYNEFINAGFLTRAMLHKKMGDLGGHSSKLAKEKMDELIRANMEATRTIQFYEGVKELDKEQENALEKAKETFFKTQKELTDYELQIREQYNQTADNKAEQKLIEWFVFNFSYYEDEVDGKKELFPVFEGDSYVDKREFYLKLCDEDNLTDPKLLKHQQIFQSSFDTIVKAINIWYNKFGDTQEQIDEKIKTLFSEDEE